MKSKIAALVVALLAIVSLEIVNAQTVPLAPPVVDQLSFQAELSPEVTGKLLTLITQNNDSGVKITLPAGVSLDRIQSVNVVQMSDGKSRLYVKLKPVRIVKPVPTKK